MKVIVLGAVGYGDIKEIISIQRFLKEKGFEVIDQFKNLDYSYVEDFRDKKELCEKIIKNDLKYVSEADVVIFLVTKPSFGAMAETIFSYLTGKYVIALCKDKVKSPWPIYFSNYIVKNESELIDVLKNIKLKDLKTIPNNYGEVEIELTYRDFTCICPITKKRDVAKLRIRYIPNEKLLEYESLKRYFKKFEDKELYHEEVVNIILNDLIRIIKPKYVEITAEFEERSNVKATVRKCWKSKGLNHEGICYKEG